MTVGDSSEWDGFIASGGVASILTLTLDAWAQMTPPGEREPEVRTSIRLYSTMVKNQDRQRHRDYRSPVRGARRALRRAAPRHVRVRDLG